MSVDLFSLGGKVTTRYTTKGMERLDGIIKKDDPFCDGIFSEGQDGSVIPPEDCRRMAEALRRKATKILEEASIFESAAEDGGFEQR